MTFTLLLLYETSLLLISMALASWLHVKAKSSVDSVAIPIINTFATKICLGFFIPYVVTLLGLNYANTYLAIALTVFIFLEYIYNKRPDCLTIVPQSINQFLEKRENLLLLLLFIVLGPVLFISIGPPQDFDSLLVINNIYDWSYNPPVPFDAQKMSGVITWEIGFLPSFVITKSAYFWCWINLQTLFVIALSSITIARRLQVNKWLATLSVIASLSLYHFWFYPGSFGIKSDFALCAGVILFFLGLTLVTERNNSESLLLVSLGAAFILTKEMGPLLLFGALILYSMYYFYLFKGSISASDFTSVFKGVGFIALPLAGHEYLRNTVVYGNPVYPTPLHIGPLHLPGIEQSATAIFGTSIFSNLNKKQVWEWWLGIGINPHPVGFLLPYVILVTICLCIYVLINGLVTKNIPVWTPLACYAAFTWILFMYLPYTASSLSGNFDFIIQLRSFRYNLGGAILVELLFTRLLMRKGFLKDTASYVFVFVNLVSRVYLLYFYVPVDHFGALNYPNAPTDLYLEGTFVLALSGILIYLLPGKMRGVGVFVVLLGLVMFSPYIFDKNRNLIGERWIPITNELAESPGTSVYLLRQLVPKEGGVLSPYIYAAAGNHFQHIVTLGNITNLSKRSRLKRLPMYVAVIAPTPGLTEKDIDTLSMFLSELGYFKINNDQWSAIYRLSPQIASTQSPSYW